MEYLFYFLCMLLGYSLGRMTDATRLKKKSIRVSNKINQKQRTTLLQARQRVKTAFEKSYMGEVIAMEFDHITLRRELTEGLSVEEYWNYIIRQLGYPVFDDIELGDNYLRLRDTKEYESLYIFARLKDENTILNDLLGHAIAYRQQGCPVGVVGDTVEEIVYRARGKEESTFEYLINRYGIAWKEV